VNTKHTMSELDETASDNVRKAVLYKLYSAFVSIAPEEKINLKEVDASIIEEFKNREAEAFVAAWEFNQLKKDFISGESLPVMRDIALTAFILFGKTAVTVDQFVEAGARVEAFWVNRGELEA